MSLKNFIILSILFICGFFIFFQNAQAEGIVINEFVADPMSGNEWVELFNISTTSLVLSDFKICDERETGCKSIAGTIPANGWMMVDLFTASFLNNSGDSVILKDSEDVILDEIVYSGSSMIAKKGESLARVSDGLDNDKLSDWVIATVITPGTTNTPTAPPTTPPTTTPPIDPPTTTPPIDSPTTTPIGWSVLKINEFVADPMSGNEWVELFNISTSSLVLAGFKICDVQETNCKSVAGTIEADSWMMVDLFTASFLNNSGDSVILKNSEDVILDEVLYSGSSMIAKKGESLSRISDGFDNDDSSDWVITAVMTPGTTNTPTTTPPTTTPPIDPPTTTPPIDPPTTTPIDWNVLKINEFVADPILGNEWVELFNLSTSSIAISDFEICDVRETGCKSVAGTIPASGWMMVDLFTASFLNNSGDSVILKDSEGIVLDEIIYSGGMIAEKGESLARIIDGLDSNALSDWAITTEITPSTTNIINAPVVEVPSGGGVGGYVPSVILDDEEKKIEDIFGIILNEVFPNPYGSDLANEFIEIKNISSNIVDLEGWKIKDLSRVFELDDEIKAGEIFYWKRDLTKIALNNSTAEEISLVSPHDIVVDQVKYDKAVEGSSFARTDSGTWKWTTDLTSGAENIFRSNFVVSSTVASTTIDLSVASTSTSGIVWKIKAPSTGALGEKLLFNASDSVDERGGKISFQWDFNDGEIRLGSVVEHVFTTSGVHSIGVVANSTMGSSDQKELKIDIDKALLMKNTGVVISEIFANPEGVDSREFIEIANLGINTVDLSGWSLRLQDNKQYFFVDGVLIKPSSRLVFYKLATNLSINNAKDQITLLDRDGYVVDSVKIGKSEAGKIYAKQDENWFWVDIPTPGSKNMVTVGIKNTIKPKTTKKSYSSKNFYKPLVISDVRIASVGDNVKTRGIVTVLPGIFGTQYFYIFDGEAGIQIYQYKKDFPELKIGDYIEVYGTISESRGVKRVKISGKQAIDILEIQKDIIPTLFELNEVAEESLGSLLKMSGEITEIKSNFMYLDNDIDEIKVYFKKGAGINKKEFKEGDVAEITGVLDLLSGEFVVMPRDQSDIKVIKSVENLAILENKEAEDVRKEVVKKYLITTVSGVVTVLSAVLLRIYGITLVKWVKKLFK